MSQPVGSSLPRGPRKLHFCAEAPACLLLKPDQEASQRQALESLSSNTLPGALARLCSPSPGLADPSPQPQVSQPYGAYPLYLSGPCPEVCLASTGALGSC